MKTQDTAFSGQKQASDRLEPMTSRRVSVRPPKLRHHKPTGQGDVYTVATYRRAIARAIEAAFPPPEPLAQQPGERKAKWQKRLTKKQREELKAWHKQFHWHPHQLRHNAGTFLRKEFGLETARIIILGHRSAAITEVYAELDHQKALAAIVRVG